MIVPIRILFVDHRKRCSGWELMGALLFCRVTLVYLMGTMRVLLLLALRQEMEQRHHCRRRYLCDRIWSSLLACSWFGVVGYVHRGLPAVCFYSSIYGRARISHFPPCELNSSALGDFDANVKIQISTSKLMKLLPIYLIATQLNASTEHRHHSTGERGHQ